ncbi:hypothetical protein DL98DRAFT_440305, partial [Cadophora sp. DSE1049]
TPDFEEREEVLEFIQVKGEYTRERLAEITIKLLEELKLKHKLFAITGDNASNNGTLYYHLFQYLREEYDNWPFVIRPRIRFYGKLSFILLNRKPIYDVDTRWNSAYNIIVQYLELKAEYSDFCNSYF